MAGSCLFCDATGGDYFDYIPLTRGRKQLVAVVVADVSGHGVSAALTMAGIRAQLHSRITLPGSAGDILAHLNGQLSVDSEETGQFITLFYLEIDLQTRHLSWIRAGHDPAFLYDPGTDTFEALAGRGLPLGVDADCAYLLQHKQARDGQVLLLVTDGIAETRNTAGEMYGRERFQAAVRLGIPHNAESIRDTVLYDLAAFRGTAPQEDDVTLVVVKFEAAESR